MPPWNYEFAPKGNKVQQGDGRGDIVNTGADCMMQLRDGQGKSEDGFRVAHRVELLAESLKK